jgi:hypothetical protein
MPMPTPISGIAATAAILAGTGHFLLAINVSPQTLGG